MISKEDLEAIQLCRTAASHAVYSGAIHDSLVDRIKAAIDRLTAFVAKEARTNKQKDFGWISCSFCGGDHPQEQTDGCVWFVVCTVCQAQGPQESTPKEARLAWNGKWNTKYDAT